MNNICIIHGNNICRNDVFERRKKIRKYNSLVTCLHNIFMKYSNSRFHTINKTFETKKRRRNTRKKFTYSRRKAIENGTETDPSGSITAAFLRNIHPLNTPKYNIKFLHLPRWGNFHARMITASHDRLETWDRLRFIQRREFEKIVFDTVSRRGIANRVPVVRHEASKRDRFETRDESFGLSTPPAAYMYTRAVSSVLRREMALWGEKVRREERERERSFLLWN